MSLQSKEVRSASSIRASVRPLNRPHRSTSRPVEIERMASPITAERTVRPPSGGATTMCDGIDLAPAHAHHRFFLWGSSDARPRHPVASSEVNEVVVY